jgi:hypothetical protein
MFVMSASTWCLQQQRRQVCRHLCKSDGTCCLPTGLTCPPHACPLWVRGCSHVREAVGSGAGVESGFPHCWLPLRFGAPVGNSSSMAWLKRGRGSVHEDAPESDQVHRMILCNNKNVTA